MNNPRLRRSPITGKHVSRGLAVRVADAREALQIRRAADWFSATCVPVRDARLHARRRQSPARSERAHAGWLGSPVWIFVVMSLLALFGCTVGPAYHAPNSTLPSSYSELNRSAQTNHAGPVTTNVETLERWWETFHDAKLNSLIHRA